MLRCSCGWMGVNLLPNVVNDTADCPMCHTPFAGYKANDAIVVSDAKEQEEVDEAEKALLLAKVLSGKDK